MGLCGVHQMHLFGKQTLTGRSVSGGHLMC